MIEYYKLLSLLLIMRTTFYDLIDLEKVKHFAWGAHEGQTYNGHQYGYHLWRVEKYAEEYIHLFKPPLRIAQQYQVYAVCWLHDCLEDTQATYEQIEDLAGPEVAQAVQLIGPNGMTRRQRLEHLAQAKDNQIAVFVKLCDRLANVEECRQNKDMQRLLMYRKEWALFIVNLGLVNLGLSAEPHPFEPMVNELRNLLFN